MSVAPANALEIAVQPDGLGVGGNAPFRSSEEDPDVSRIEVHHARRNGVALYGLIDSGKDDGVLGDVNDSAAAGEIGDDFVLVLLLGKSVNRGRA